MYDEVHRLSNRNSLSSMYLELALLGPMHLKITNMSHNMSWDSQTPHNLVFQGCAFPLLPALCQGFQASWSPLGTQGPPWEHVTATLFSDVPPTQSQCWFWDARMRAWLSPSIGVPRYWQTLSSIPYPRVEAIFFHWSSPLLCKANTSSRKLFPVGRSCSMGWIHVGIWFVLRDDLHV